MTHFLLHSSSSLSSPADREVDFGVIHLVFGVDARRAVDLYSRQPTKTKSLQSSNLLNDCLVRFWQGPVVSHMRRHRELSRAEHLVSYHSGGEKRLRYDNSGVAPQ